MPLLNDMKHDIKRVPFMLVYGNRSFWRYNSETNSIDTRTVFKNEENMAHLCEDIYKR